MIVMMTAMTPSVKASRRVLLMHSTLYTFGVSSPRSTYGSCKPSSMASVGRLRTPLWHRGSWLLGWCPNLADYGTGMEPTAGDHRRKGARVGYGLDDSIPGGRNSTRGGPSCPT